jgi:recombination protein RecA
VRIEVRRIGAIKDGDQVIGNRTKIKVVKNKVAAPFREVEVDILYGQGISREGDLLDLGATHEVVEKSGSWFSYAGERLGQGRDNARLFLKEHTDIRDKLDLAVRQKLGLIEMPPVKPTAPETASNGKSQTA